MSLLKTLSYIFIIFFIFELVIFLMINFFRGKIPWIITNDDEYPIFDKKKIKSFFNKTFDAHLGWNGNQTQNMRKNIFKNQQNFFWCSGEKEKILKIKKNI